MNKRSVSIIVGYLLITVLSGCATIKETAKGFAGVSTQVLEDKRQDALKKSFVLDYNACYVKVKDILTEDPLDTGVARPYIYSEDSQKKMIAIYLSETDTTPVGIFFTENDGANTTVEISSPSIYAKEEMAKIIFTGIDALIKPKVSIPASSLVTDSQSQEEKNADVEKKVND